MVNLALQLTPMRANGMDRPERADDSRSNGLLTRWSGFAKRRPLASLAALGIATQAVGLFGAPFAARIGAGRYKALLKSSVDKPWSALAPVWTGPYAAMAASAWLVSRSEQSDVQRRALQLFGGQLLLNAAWAPMFFGSKAPTVALLETTTLLAAAAAATEASLAVRPSAGALLVPYVALVAFAAGRSAGTVLLDR